MKTVYTLTVSWLNGTVTMGSETSVYANSELAEKAKAAVEKANEGSFFDVICNINETNLYESEDEVPILRNLKND